VTGPDSHDAGNGSGESFAAFRLYLVATPEGKDPRVLSASSATGAILARFKDEDDPIRFGVVCAWQLGNFPEQFEVLDHDAGQPFLRPVGRPSVRT
jgi:hypothetical protein